MNLIRKAFPILGILAALFTFLPTDSVARDRDYPHERIFRHAHRMHERVFRSVPHRIYYSSRAYYQPYYYGRVYFRPHHHYHVAYRFPIYVGGTVVYRPAYYCGAHLFVRGEVDYGYNVRGEVDYGYNDYDYGDYNHDDHGCDH